MARLPVEFFDPTAKQQLLNLPSKQLKRRALELLAEVSKENPKLGKPCGFAFSTGNQRGCGQARLRQSILKPIVPSGGTTWTEICAYGTAVKARKL